jgi:hypothetical protein
VTVRRLLLAGLAIGVLAGLIAAVAIPRTRAAGKTTQALQLGPAGVVRTAPPRRPRRSGGFITLRLRTTPRIEARAKDPRGGPDWAVRVFRADRVVPPDDRRHGVNPVIGHNLCAQLGRVYRGRFGWIDATGTFRPATIDYRGAPLTCGSRRPNLAGQPFFDVVEPITDPRKAEAHVKELVAWGLAGSGASRVQLQLAARTVTAPPSTHGAFLATGPRELQGDHVRGTITYRGGRSLHLPLRAPGPGASSQRMILSGRAPDPNGGLPYALLSSSTCTGWGPRVVEDDRYGTIDYELGTLDELRRSGGGACGRSPQDDAKLFATYPVQWGFGDGGDDPGSDPDAGRIARRTQRGVTIFTGRAAPDVVAVTLETPRDVRTLIPGGPAHAIIAAYDGSFPTGGVKVIAQFKDGHTKTQSLGTLGF